MLFNHKNKLFTFDELNKKTQLKVIEHHRVARNKKEITERLKTEILNILNIKTELTETEYFYHLKKPYSFNFNLRFNLTEFVFNNEARLKEALKLNNIEFKKLLDRIQTERLFINIHELNNNMFIQLNKNNRSVISSFVNSHSSPFGWLDDEAEVLERELIEQLLNIVFIICSDLIIIRERVLNYTVLFFKEVNLEDVKNFYKFTLFNYQGVPIPSRLIKMNLNKMN